MPAVMWKLAAGGESVDMFDGHIDGIRDRRGANEMRQDGQLLFVQENLLCHADFRHGSYRLHLSQGFFDQVNHLVSVKSCGNLCQKVYVRPEFPRPQKSGGQQHSRSSR